MRLLILASLFLPSMAFANFVKGSTFQSPSSIYAERERCEAVEGEECYSITGKDVRKLKLGFVTVLAGSTSDCSDGADCQAKITDLEFRCQRGATMFDDKANWPGLDFTVLARPSTGFFLWCQQNALVLDQTLSDEVGAADQKLIDDQLARDGAKGPRELSLQQCVQDSKNPTLSPAQVKDCISALVREILGNKINPADL